MSYVSCIHLLCAILCCHRYIRIKLNPNGSLKPVMVWIHGGGFNTGSGNGESDFCGPNYLLDRDIVFVTINYRLGALGRFYFENLLKIILTNYHTLSKDFLQLKTQRPQEIMG